MTKLKIFISLIIFALSCSVVFAAPHELKIQYDDNRDMPQEHTVLQGSVTQIQELPSGMYGMWQVKGTLLETNDYARYAPHSNDIWVLRKDGNFVTLMNPQNGASATITVTAVEDNTATFTRGVKTYISKDSEQVTLTLQGDTFYGTDLIVNQESNYGIMQTSVARYRINGVKISGETLYKPKTNIKFQF
ncbi:MAG: hypothetical protein MJ180_01120 [Candidatus Gastranaerophilales bacterium]|nr:hypothetical protein [Candidatus Gastranaerophilales bacterium]